MSFFPLPLESYSSREAWTYCQRTSLIDDGYLTLLPVNGSLNLIIPSLMSFCVSSLHLSSSLSLSLSLSLLSLSLSLFQAMADRLSRYNRLVPVDTLQSKLSGGILESMDRLEESHQVVAARLEELNVLAPEGSAKRYSAHTAKETLTNRIELSITPWWQKKTKFSATK